MPLSPLGLLIAQIESQRAEIRKKETDIIKVSKEIGSIEKEIALKNRKKLVIDPDLISDSRIKKALLMEMKKDLNKAVLAITELCERFEELNDPATALNEFPNRTPFLLFPVRLETRYRDLDLPPPAVPKLLVRIYPDVLAVDTFEEQFTNDEIEKAKWYFAESDRIDTEEIGMEAMTTIPGADYTRLCSEVETDFASDIAAIEDEGAKKEFIRMHVLDRWKPTLRYKRRVLAWTELVSNVGLGRAAYIQSKGKPYFSDLPTYSLKKDSWVKAPQSHIMPDYFVIRLYRKKIVDGKAAHELYIQQKGTIIPNPLRVGPDPSTIGSDSASFFDENSKWMYDFDKAKEFGMALEINLVGLTREQIRAGFSRVVAIGLRLDNGDFLEETVGVYTNELIMRDWIDHHHYSDGFSFVKQGTPTNNTEATQSTSGTDEKKREESYEVECGDAMVSAGEATKDGHRFLAALGLETDTSPVSHVSASDGTDSEDAKQMAIALWPVTWRNYLALFSMKYPPEMFGTLAKEHFIKYVRARGPYPAFRVGNVPYGILPVSSLSAWDVNSGESTASERDFYSFLLSLLKKLFSYWKMLAEDVERIPRVGATDDPDRELVGVLGMQAGSLSYGMRNIVTESYLKNLLRYVWPTLFKSEDLVTKIVHAVKKLVQRNSQPASAGESDYSLQSLLESYDRTKAESQALLKDFTGWNFDSSPADLAAWGSGFDLDLPLVQEGPLSEESDGPLGKPAYIEVLNGFTSVEAVRAYEYEGRQPILFTLLREAILSTGDTTLSGSLGYLSRLSSAKLERLLSEILDLSTHRLDAWITSLATRRLERLRASEKKTYIGAYGWIEDLAPAGERKSGGYVHAPSPTQAVTAAVLRNAYLTHADAANAERMSVNLSSGRVKKALWILEGIREGQPLAVLLGYRFERLLHEKHMNGTADVYLDQFILPFRTCYPLIAGKETDTAPEESVENLAPRNVVDGNALLKAYKADTIPFGTKELPTAGSPEYKAILRDLDELDETFDAVSDLLLAESVHQAVLGNYIASGAALNAASADGSPPDEIQVARTPRGGIDVKYHVLAVFGDPVQTPSGWPETPRALASAALNAWAGRMLGDPAKIIGYAEYPDTTANVLVKVEFNLIGLIDPRNPENTVQFGFSPLDFVYLSQSSGKSEETELENRIRYCIRKLFSLPKDREIRLSFGRDLCTFADETPIGEMLPLARAMLRLISSSSCLVPEDLCLPEETADGPTTTDDNRFGGYVHSDSGSDYRYLRGREDESPQVTHTLQRALKDFTNIRTSISDILVTIPVITDTLDPERVAALVGDLRPLIENLRHYNISVRIPMSAIEDDGPALVELIDVSHRALAQMGDRLAKCIAIRDEADDTIDMIEDSTTPNTRNDMLKKAINLLSQCFKELFGKSFAVLPSFCPANNAELMNTFDPDHSTLCCESECNGIRKWFGQAAQTHPAIRQLETLLALEEMSSRSFNNLRVGQLPFKENDRWIALEWPQNTTREEKEARQGTLSVVVYAEGEIDFDSRICGLAIDKWDEMIPHDEEVTSISYQYDRPGNEAPNVCLLCVSPVVGPDGSATGWSWDHLVKTVEETIDLAKVRTVDSDAFKKLGNLLPGIYLPAGADREACRINVPFGKI